MNRLRALIAALILLLAGCGSAQPPILMAEQDVVPLSYQVRAAQLATANAIKEWAQECGMGEPEIGDLSWNGKWPWSRDSQTISEPDTGGQGWDFAITFSFTGFDPDRSAYSWGQPRESDDRLVSHPDQTLLIDATNYPRDLTENLTRTVTLHNSSSTTTTQTTSVDIGAKIGFEVGGEAAGGKITGELSTLLGISHTDATTNVNATDTTTSVQVSTTVPSGHASLATISGPQITTKTDFDVSGATNGGFTLWFNDGLFPGYINQLQAGPNYGVQGDRHYIRWDSFDDWEATVRGYSVDFPNQTSALCPGHIAAVRSANQVTWQGTVTNVSETSVSVAFQDVADPQQAIIDHSIPQDRVITEPSG